MVRYVLQVTTAFMVRVGVHGNAGGRVQAGPPVSEAAGTLNSVYLVLPRSAIDVPML